MTTEMRLVDILRAEALERAEASGKSVLDDPAWQGAERLEHLEATIEHLGAALLECRRVANEALEERRVEFLPDWLEMARQGKTYYRFSKDVSNPSRE